MDVPPAPLVVSATRATWLATHGSHPNVVRVLGVHHLASGPRLMIEQVPGRTLEALIDAAFPERLPLPEILAVVRDCTRGLHFLHELRDQRGTAVRLVHGTMAPPLVAVGFDGVARVAGLERLCATRGAPRPDPRFAAPEQSQEGAAVDRRADVFALAAVLLRAATGLQLRDGLVPVPTSQAIPYVPQSIEDVLRKALAPDPAKRFATAEDLRAAIERCVVNEGLAAGPDRVSLMVSRYLPDVPVAPAPSQLPPRPDQSLWGPGGAAAQSNWMPVESVLDTSEPSSASGFDAISVQVPRPAMRPSQPPAPNPLVPSAAAGQRTMTVAALDEATEIAQVPLPPTSEPPRLPAAAPSAPRAPMAPDPGALPLHIAPLPYQPPPPQQQPPYAPHAVDFIGLPEAPPRRSIIRDPIFLVGIALVLFFGTLLVTYFASA